MKSRYLKMIRAMDAGGERAWSVYILRCDDGSLYTGIAKDVDARFASHQAGRGASYTRLRRPVAIVYREPNLTRSEALIREASVKRLPKDRKEKLVKDPAAADPGSGAP